MTQQALYLRAMVVLTVLTACGATLVSLRWSGGIGWTDVIVLAALAFVGQQTNIRRLVPGIDLSITSIVLLAGIALAGPVGAVLVSTVPFAIEPRRLPLSKRIFNVAMMAVLVCAAAAAYRLAGGQVRVGDWQHSTPDSIFGHLLLPLLVADVTLCVLNAAILGVAVSLDNVVPYREVVTTMLRGGGIAYMGYGVFGLLLAVLWGPAGIGPLAAVLVLAPLMVARWTYAQYAEENAAHERALRALVGAVETKDLYTRGHSERVAKAALLIGRAMGLSQERISTLRFAGMLHDVGKIGVPTEVLRKTGPLTEDEFASIALHPVRGLEMIRDIEFLGEALAGILHHHERLDGRGYPMGLSGTSIPEFARMLAVADAFDSMTSTRSYRGARSVEEAVEELRRCAGSQFDPEFVAALERALQEAEWIPTVTDPAPDVVPTRLVDHDDPSDAPVGQPAGRVRAAAFAARRVRP